MGARSVLVLAELADEERAAIEQDCQNCNFEVTWLTSAETVAAKLISGRFDALVVHLQTPGAARACVEARKTLTRVRFPIMALADHVDDATFAKAFRVGVDDVIDLTASAQVSQRLAAIPRASWKPVARSRGEALIVDPDNNRAEALARLLKEAGYLIKSARDEPSAKLHLWRQSIRLVVVDNSVQETARWIKEGNSKEWHPIWIVRARPDQMDDVSERLYAFTNASAVNIYLGDADVMYEANRLSAAYESRRPAAARLFYGTTVTFSTGSPDSIDAQWIEHGSTYSIDVHEIAIRTLALPPSTELELSLTPPGRETAITLQAEVTQRRVFGAVQDQFSPPGFTAQLSGEHLAIWRDAVRALGRQRFGPKWTPSGEAMTAIQPSATASAVAEPPPPKSSQPSHLEPPSSVEPTSPSPASPPSSISVPISLDPPSSKPTSSKPTSSKPTSSKPTSSKPTSSKPTSSEPTSSEPPSSRPSGSVPIARVRLVSGSAPQGGSHGTAPTLKSLHDEALEALAVVGDPDVPSTTPSRTEGNASESEKNPKSPAATPADESTSESQSRQHGTSVEAPPGSQARASAPKAQGRARIVVLPTPAAPAAVAAEPPKRKLGWLAVVLVLAALVGLWALASSRQQPSAVATPTAVPPTAVKAPTSSPAVPTASPEPQPPATTPATSAPSTEASGQQPGASSSAPTESEAPAAASGAPASAAQTPKDPSELPAHLGYLYVSSTIDTQVFVQGKAAGKTNSYLEVFCGRRYLRLGTAPGEWQSAGVGFKIACQKVSRITLLPR